MATTVIVFNANTGSDTAASGAPPNMVPITGISASLTAGSNTINLSADNPDLTNVPTDHTAIIWVNRTDGRNSWRIYSKDNTNKTILVTPTPDVTGTFQWAIGGKRATFEDANSRKIIQYGDNATIYTETDQTINSTLVWGLDLTPGQWFGGVQDGGRKVLTITVDQDCVTASPYPGLFRNLVFRCTAATKATAKAIGGIRSSLENCVIGTTSTDSFVNGMDYPTYIADCAFLYLQASAINGSHSDEAMLRNVVIAHCGSHGVNVDYSPIRFIDVISAFNGGDGFRAKNHGGQFWDHCVAHGNTLSGIYLLASTDAVRINNCILSNNGRYGIESSASYAPYPFRDIRKGYNCFWQNTAGARLNFPALEGDISVDPQFADPANLDFRVGPNLKAKGWPKFDQPIGAGQTNTYAFIDIGAAQRKEPVTKHARTIFIPSL